MRKTPLIANLVVLMTILCAAPKALVHSGSIGGQKAVPAFRIPILMYHYIVDPRQAPNAKGRDLSVSPATFARQLDWLQSHGYHAVSFRDLRKDALPEKAVIVTFDDGYKDAHDAALPLLRQRGMTATFYIVTGFLGKPGYMSWDDVRELQRSGMDIGGHTVTHRQLTGLGPQERRREIVQCVDTLQSTLHLVVDSFAYPFGKFNRETEAILREAAIPYAVSTREGTADGRDNPLALPRLRMKEKTNLSLYLH